MFRSLFEYSFNFVLTNYDMFTYLTGRENCNTLEQVPAIKI